MSVLVNDWTRHALFAALGLAVGYLIGRGERVAQAGKSSRARWGDIARVGFGLVLIALVVATYLQAVAVTDCYRSAFSQVIGSIKERTDASAATSAAQRRFLLAIRDNPDDPVPEIDAYLLAADRLDQARAAAPLPPVPECGR